jgi:uncharacterized protein (DUF2336 family)
VQAPTTLIAELENAFHCGSSQQRAAMVSRITDLFVAGAGAFDADQIGLFGQVFSHLVDEIETNALAELSARLAPLESSPPDVIARLAVHDEIVVAGPVLRHACRLDDGSLVEAARTGSQGHLLAISARPRLNEPVTDVLVDRGGSAVLHSVAANAGARFSQSGLAALIRHAEADDDLAGKIIERRDVPPQMFCRLLLQATNVVKQRLLARAQPETRDLINQVLAKVSGDIAAKTAAAPDYAGALRDLLGKHPGGKLTEADLRELAIQHEGEQAVAALSLISSIPVDALDRVMRVDKIGPIVILCRAFNFAWATARALLDVRSTAGLSPQKLAAARDDFERLSRAAAQQVVQQWQARGAAAD